MLEVASVPYLVARPVDCGLDREEGIRFSMDEPATLVRRLRAGEVDVALVSSIELFRHPDYAYIDGLGVTGEGFVSSVQVFLRRPVAEVASIAVDPASRTAATLVRLVWPRRSPGPEFIDVEPGRDPREVAADAWLRIGDGALREYLEPGAPEVFNPSAAWVAETGLLFPFAVWIVRPGCDPTPHAAAFLRARQRGAARLDELAREASSAWKLPLEATRRYLGEECLYEPGARLGPALEAFGARAAAAGLCRGDLRPRALALSPTGDPV